MVHEFCCNPVLWIIMLLIYRVFQEEMSKFWEVIVSVILSKKVYMYMCPIPNTFRDRAISLHSSLDLVPNIVLPSRMWISVKQQFAIVTSDSDIVGVLWKLLHIFTNAEYDVSCPHMSCKVHRCWRQNFWKCIILGNLYQLCHLNNKYQY
jgi:hypothetical protein